MKECPKCELCFPDDVVACPHDGTATRLSLPGPQIIASRYLLESRLGRGAMGQVYLARDNKFDARKVAVKTVRPDILSSDDLQEGEAIARFGREAQAAASIQHPNTVSVTDFGETADGIFYLVMEYVEGETLHKLLRREGTLPVKRAVRLLRQIADGVDAAHDLEILHRDLKPANIFIMLKGKSGEGFVKVGDFGLAKIINQAATDISSGAGPASRGIVGTPEYMSPEQMQPEMTVDKRSDLYALGTIAYLMLGGKTPFSGDIMQLIMQKVMQTPPPLSSLRSDVPANVDRVIMRALEIDPEKRPASVADWIAELETAAEDIDENKRIGGSRLVVMAPVGAEVYVDDERRGSVGSSGRVILNNIPPGQHILRVSKPGERDDERVIEIRDGDSEQVIQAQLRALHGTASQPSPSSGTGSSGAPQSSVMPGIVACSNCNSRFAEGVRFCGRCGSGRFTMITPGQIVSTFPCPRCSAPLPNDSKFCGRCGMNMGSSSRSGGSGSGRSDPPASAGGTNIGYKAAYTPLAHTGGSAPNFTASGQNARAAERICQRCGDAALPHVKFCGRCGLTLQ